MSHIEFLKNAWNAVYDPKINVTEAIEKFFHVDYEQCINGVILDRAKYIDHVVEQKKNMKINSINYTHVMERENELFTIYYPKGQNINNLPIEAEVIAYFRFENKQIFRIHGQVRLIKGDVADVDMK